MNSKRILITGLSTYWGGRLAKALEADPSIEAIVGVDNEEPSVELERTEYVKVGTQHALLRRVVEAAEIDTVVDTRLVVDSVTTTSRKAHENNVIGTMNVLAACTGPNQRAQADLQVIHALLRLRAGRPSLLSRGNGTPTPARTAIEKDILEAEASVADFADKSPDTDVTILRFANVLGPDVRTSHIALFSLPAVPMILGFDPRYQFVHEDDVVHALEHVVQRSCRASSTWRPTACWRCRRWPAYSARATRRYCRPGVLASRRASCDGWASTSLPRCSARCASAAGWTTAA